MKQEMNIWQYQTLITRRLRAWAISNIAGGTLLILRPHPFAQGFGIQSAAWGLVNLLIAIFGQRSSERRAADPGAHTPETLAAETKKLRRILWLNAGLDVGYMLGGWLLARHKGREDARWRGQGWGIVLQGVFLCLFDVVHARLLGDGKAAGGKMPAPNLTADG